MYISHSSVLHLYKSFYSVRKAYISLIELLVVISILVMVAGVVGVNVNKTIREQKFNTEAALVLDKIRLAQDMMLVLRSDVHLIFRQNPSDKSISMWMELEKPLKNVKIDLQKIYRLTAIQFVDSKDHLQAGETKMGEINIKFLSGGNVMSQGNLRLSTSETGKDRGSIDRYILLPGYPRPLQMALTHPEKQEANVFKEVASDERLTAITMQELQDLGALKEPQAEQPQKESEEDKTPDNGKDKEKEKKSKKDSGKKKDDPA